MKLLLPILILFSSLFAIACPKDINDIDGIYEAIKESTSCYKASDIANQCSRQSASDASLVALAVEVCEKELPELSLVDSVVFDRMKNQCYKKYENEEGGQYESAASFCKLKVVNTFVSVFAPLSSN